MSLTATEAAALKAATSGEVDKAVSLTTTEASALKAGINAEVDKVPPPPLPTISNATITPAALPVGGGSVIIDATVLNGTPTVDNLAVVLPVTLPVSQSRTFVLSATGPGGNAAPITLSVAVAQPPVVPPIAWPLVKVYNSFNNTMGLEFRIVKDNRYFRFQEPVEFTTDKIEAITSQSSGIAKPLDFHCVNQAGAEFILLAPIYKLFVGQLDALGNFVGVERGSVTVPAGSKRAAFSGAVFGNELDGESLFAIVPCDATGAAQAVPLETNAPHPFIVNRTGKAKDTAYVYACANSWDVYENNQKPALAKLPKSWFTPKALPLIQQPIPLAFTTSILSTPLYRHQLAPHGTTGSLTPHHLITRLDGTQHTRCKQGYTPDYYMDFYNLPNRDGPRNVSDHYFHILPIPGRNGKLYTHTYNAFVRINADGNKITRWGAYHTYAPDYTQAKVGGPEEAYAGTTSDPRLTGPANHRLIAWGGDWDWKSLELDPAAPTIGGEAPHGDRVTRVPLDPRWIAADERGYLVEIVGDGQDPNRSNPDPKTWAPMDARVLAEGFNVPRGFAHRRGTREAFVSDTGANRIARINIDTGAVIDYLVENTMAIQYGYTPKIHGGGPYYRRFTYTAGQNPLTLRPLGIKCIAPESGVYYTEADGSEWYAWINRATLQIAKINIATKVVTIVGDLYFAAGADPGNQVCQLAVNDNLFIDAQGNRPRGGFGVHGTFYAITFYLQQNGHPQVYEPQADGTYKDVSAAFSGNYTYDTMAGRSANGGYANMVYPTGIAIGYNLCYLTSCISGISVFRKADANDPVIDRGANVRGAAFWRSKGYHILSHVGGPNTPNGVLPWGENPDMDKWFLQHGHMKP